MSKTETRIHDREDAERELRLATEAVDMARDAVIEAADMWEMSDGYRVGDLEHAVLTLREAKEAEANARAKLEALRG